MWQTRLAAVAAFVTAGCATGNSGALSAGIPFSDFPALVYGICGRLGFDFSPRTPCNNAIFGFALAFRECQYLHPTKPDAFKSCFLGCVPKKGCTDICMENSGKLQLDGTATPPYTMCLANCQTMGKCVLHSVVSNKGPVSMQEDLNDCVKGYKTFSAPKPAPSPAASSPKAPAAIEAPPPKASAGSSAKSSAEIKDSDVGGSAAATAAAAPGPAPLPLSTTPNPQVSAGSGALDKIIAKAEVKQAMSAGDLEKLDKALQKAAVAGVPPAEVADANVQLAELKAAKAKAEAKAKAAAEKKKAEEEKKKLDKIKKEKAADEKKLKELKGEEKKKLIKKIEKKAKEEKAIIKKIEKSKKKEGSQPAWVTPPPPPYGFVDAPNASSAPAAALAAAPVAAVQWGRAVAIGPTAPPAPTGCECDYTGAVNSVSTGQAGCARHGREPDAGQMMYCYVPGGKKCGGASESVVFMGKGLYWMDCEAPFFAYPPTCELVALRQRHLSTPPPMMMSPSTTPSGPIPPLDWGWNFTQAWPGASLSLEWHKGHGWFFETPPPPPPPPTPPPVLFFPGPAPGPSPAPGPFAPVAPLPSPAPMPALAPPPPKLPEPEPLEEPKPKKKPAAPPGLKKAPAPMFAYAPTPSGEAEPPPGLEYPAPAPAPSALLLLRAGWLRR